MGRGGGLIPCTHLEWVVVLGRVWEAGVLGHDDDGRGAEKSELTRSSHHSQWLEEGLGQINRLQSDDEFVLLQENDSRAVLGQGGGGVLSSELATRPSSGDHVSAKKKDVRWTRWTTQAGWRCYHPDVCPLQARRSGSRLRRDINTHPAGKQATSRKWPARSCDCCCGTETRGTDGGVATTGRHLSYDYDYWLVLFDECLLFHFIVLYYYFIIIIHFINILQFSLSVSFISITIHLVI